MNKGMQDGYVQAANQSIEKIESETEAIALKAREIARIVDADGEARAAEFLKQIKLRLTQVADSRTALIKPLKDHVKKLEGEFNRVSKPLELADEAVRAGMVAYRNSVVFKEAEAKRQEIEAQARTAAATGDVGKLSDLSDQHRVASEAAPRKVETMSGEARFRKVWRFEITDLEKLPAEFWTPDEAKIKKQVGAGVTIPGVRSWQEETPVIV